MSKQINIVVNGTASIVGSNKLGVEAKAAFLNAPAGKQAALQFTLTKPDGTVETVTCPLRLSKSNGVTGQLVLRFPLNYAKLIHIDRSTPEAAAADKQNDLAAMLLEMAAK